LKKILIFIPLLSLFFDVKGQHALIQWSFVLDGYNNVSIVDLAVDSNGNTYAAINYTSNLTIPDLKLKLPFAPHVHGLIIKINKKGKPVWAHPFQSDFDNRINDISLTPDGDVLITGFGDGLLSFPGKKGPLKVGKAPIKSHYARRFQGFYAARYTSDGDRKWVQYWDCSWGEGISIAANKRNEVYMTFYHNGTITQNGTIIDSVLKSQKIVAKMSIAKFTGEGNLISIQNLGYELQSMAIIKHRIKFDNSDNMLLFGSFRGKIKLSENDSLTNDSYYESNDSYIAKYSADGKFLWSKKIGGQNSQILRDIVIAKDNSIYATGMYSHECLMGDNINVIQKSKYEWKSGNSFFYFHLFDDGELDFIRFEDNKGYSSDVTGSAIALDPNGKVHILGNFNDTLQINGHSIATWHHNQHGFYSLWNNQTIEHLEKTGESPGSLNATEMDINKAVFAVGGEYYGDNNYLNVRGKKLKLSNLDYGRVTYIYGGKIPDEKNIPDLKLVKKDSLKINRLEKMESLLACTKVDQNPAADNWFPIEDTLMQTEVPISNHPCGETITGMEASLYPNPTAKELNIKFIGMEGTVLLDIYTSGGSLILSERLEVVLKEQTITFNLSQLSNGNYFVRIGHKNHEKSLRFVKVN
jgi:hypothetical protein